MTLTGPGGTGKTRLALAAARESSPRAGRSSSTSRPSQIRRSSSRRSRRARRSASRPARTRWRRSRRRWVAADRCSCSTTSSRCSTLQSISAGSCRSSASSTMIATSRAPLRITREREYAVHPLAVRESARIPLRASGTSRPSASTSSAWKSVPIRTSRSPRRTPARSPASAARSTGSRCALELAAARVRTLGAEGRRPPRRAARLARTRRPRSPGAPTLAARDDRLERPLLDDERSRGVRRARGVQRRWDARRRRGGRGEAVDVPPRSTICWMPRS